MKWGSMRGTGPDCKALVPMCLRLCSDKSDIVYMSPSMMTQMPVLGVVENKDSSSVPAVYFDPNVDFRLLICRRLSWRAGRTKPRISLT